MKWSLKGKWIAGGFSLALLLTGLASFISYQNASQLIESAAKVQRTRKILNIVTDIFASLVDAESGRRGYLLFADQKELQRYHSAIQSIDPKVKQLRQWIADEPEQKQRLVILKTLIAQRLSLSEQSVSLYQQDPSAIKNQALLREQSLKNRQEIQQIITEIHASEEQFLKLWVQQSQSSTRYRMFIELLSTVLSFGILLGTFALLYRQMLKRQKAETLQRILAQENELSELKLRFFSMVSHEFRTPLSIILGSAQLLAESSQQWTETKKLKNLHRIQSSARSMNQLLTDILTFARAEAGKLEFNPDLLDLESFCLNLIEDIQFCSKPQPAIKFISRGRCIHARLDENLLYSILSNLLSNAIKYSPQGGIIQFILSCETDVVIFQIKDQGIGIPSESYQELFEPFYRADNVRNIVGTGLGLAVVKKCVDIHQGQIFLESEVEMGTTFTVKIPKR
ncbi:CHASE3 domain-containing protein [Nostocales cyanobacterium LEGE 11386]|nr:CHASE3 domain-containing protein [Nostocales cyanobacterium LEGE 11386]